MSEDEVTIDAESAVKVSDVDAERTPPPTFPVGSIVVIIGDHPMTGQVGKVGYMYNRIALDSDREFGNVLEDGTTGWRYVVDFEDGENGYDGASIGAGHLRSLSDEEYANWHRPVVPPIQGEDELILE